MQDLAKSKPLKHFLGDDTRQEKDINALAKAERTQSRKSKYRDLSEFQPANVILQGLIDVGIASPRLEGTMLNYAAISIRDGKMLTAGDPVL